MKNPEILWAQDKQNIYLTLEIPNVKNQNIDILENRIKFNGENVDGEWGIDMELWGKIMVDDSTWAVKQRLVEITLRKDTNIYWNKLSKDRYLNLRIDWNKWDMVEEDEEEDNMSYEDMNLMNNFRDFTKTLPSELMDKDFSELLPEGLDNIDNSDSSDNESTSSDSYDSNDSNDSNSNNSNGATCDSEDDNEIDETNIEEIN